MVSGSACLVHLFCATAARPRLFFATTLLSTLGVLILLAGLLAFHLQDEEHGDVCEDAVGAKIFTMMMLISIMGPVAACALFIRFVKSDKYRRTLACVEGDLPSRLRDGSLRLLRVKWLLAQPAAFRIRRRQEMPEEAFWSPAEAEALLKKDKVAALSYRWLDPKLNDPDGFALSHVLNFYRTGRNARRRPALMIDFASLPQVDPATGQRTDDDQAVFLNGLYVMSNMYASPRVLVLQLKKMPPEREAELSGLGGVAPADRSDLIPYAGAHCRSGWCTSETACTLLTTEGGGHAYELGVGPVPVTKGVLPSVEIMRRLFNDESTRFFNPNDRTAVTEMYLDLRRNVEAFEKQGRLERMMDAIFTESTRSARRWRYVIIAGFCSSTMVAIPGIILSSMTDDSVGYLMLFISAPLILVLCCLVSWSRIFRARLLGQSGHLFHWSLYEPPLRRIPDTRFPPACFLPPMQSVGKMPVRV